MTGTDWAPMATPAVYDVLIGHVRNRPRRAFRYRATLWLVDLDDVAAGRLTRTGRSSRWLAAQARFESRDHLGDPGRSIKENVVGFAREQGVDDVARVVLLAHPRAGLGRASYAFNPLSTHWCYRADGSLACIVAEVHNTHGERHAYLLRPDERGRAEVDKAFYVSPFLSVDGRYRMHFSPPGERLDIGIALHQDGAPALTAWVRGRGRPATPAVAARALARRPLMAVRGSLLIRVQGIRLWARRLPIVPRNLHQALPEGHPDTKTGSPVKAFDRSPAGRLAALVTGLPGDLPRGRMGVDQLLFVRPADDAASGMPATPAGRVLP